MTRSLRLEHPGAIWHITSRGNERREIYRSDRDRLAFLDILAQVIELHHWIVYAYVLMSNHFHLLIETPQPTLSVGAKRLNGTYAQYFNDQHDRVGHLFQGRFKAILVERESHFLELLRYLVLNPVRSTTVEFPGDYRWSSYRATAGLAAAPRWLATREVLAEFAPGTDAECRERYRRFVADARGARYNPWEQLVGQIYLGGEAFRERAQSLVGARREVRAHPESQRNFVRPSFDSIVQLVSLAFDETESQLRIRSHHISRKALAQLAWREGGLSLVAVGAWLNVSAQAAAHLVHRGLDIERKDSNYAMRLQWVRQRLELRPRDGVEG